MSIIKNRKKKIDLHWTTTSIVMQIFENEQNTTRMSLIYFVQ